MPDIFIDQPKPTTEIPEEHHEHHRLPNKLSMLSTFVRDPLGVALAEQHEDEHILLFIRRDFVTNIPWILSTLILLILPFFVPALFQEATFSFAIIPTSIIIIITSLYFLIVLGFAFANFVTWFYDIGIVTEKRAVDIDFYNISFVSVATARAQDLKDVRYSQRGFFESLFDYGDVTLVVEASGETLTFEKAPRPAEVVSTLSALIGGHA